MAPPPEHASADARDVAWYVDKVAAGLIFAGGVSAVLFILGIFLFVNTFAINLTADVLVRRVRRK